MIEASIIVVKDKEQYRNRHKHRANNKVRGKTTFFFLLSFAVVVEGFVLDFGKVLFEQVEQFDKAKGNHVERTAICGPNQHANTKGAHARNEKRIAQNFEQFLAWLLKSLLDEHYAKYQQKVDTCYDKIL